LSSREHDNDAITPVQLHGVGRRYASGAGEISALADISLEIARGEMVALVGPSGCGKSTLLNLIGCVDLPTAGRVQIQGSSTSDLSDDALTALRREHVGTIFQSFNLLGGLTLAENIALPLLLLGWKRENIDTAVELGLARVGLHARGNARPGEVSGGQQQRAAVIRATIHRPAIVLADEPTGNLDSVNGAAVLDLLRELATAGQAILIATHSAEAAARCDRTITMHDGRIVANCA
jgi:ABC-type lipoprotein export system ATPase subunit